MREIKFRAWDGKQMLTGECLYWNGISFVSGVWNFEEEYIPTENQVAVEAMQFTGLTDANGVEIYEGDILERGDFVPPRAVTFGNGSFRLSDKTNSADQTLVAHTAGKLVVTGNIHQNPELLEQL